MGAHGEMAFPPELIEAQLNHELQIHSGLPHPLGDHPPRHPEVVESGVKKQEPINARRAADKDVGPDPVHLGADGLPVVLAAEVP